MHPKSKKDLKEEAGAIKKKPQHSSTFYLPRDKADLIVRAIKACAAEKYGVGGTLGKGSPFILDQLYLAFYERGLMDEYRNFRVEKLEELEKSLEEKAKAPKLSARKKSI